MDRPLLKELEYLTENIENPTQKPFLKDALVSHLTRLRGKEYSKEEISQAVNEFIKT